MFAKAQLAAGRAFWAEAVRRDQDGVEKQNEAIISCAAKSLDLGIRELEKSESASAVLLAGKLSLAQIALRRQDPQRVISLLDGQSGVLSQIPNEVKMSKEFVTATHELLFQAYSQTGDLNGVQSSLDNLAKQYGRNGKDRITGLRTKIARDFIDELDPNQPITLELVEQLDGLMNSVLDPKRKPTIDVILWAAQAWSDLATRSDEDLVRKECVKRSDNLLDLASTLKGLNDQERMTLRLRRIELAHRSGQTDRALTMLSEILGESPTAIDLQIKAAHFLLDHAKTTGNAIDFDRAISGRPDDSIWGWAKLTNTLARMHLDSDDKTRYLDRLLECGFHVNESRILEAESTSAAQDRTSLLETSKKHLRQLITTFAQSSESWRDKMDALQLRIIDLESK